MAPIHLIQSLASRTMFGEISAKNVTFVIDTSGSMYPYLPAVKDHLNEMILARAHREKDSMFNIIEFASAVTPWADRMVRCTPQTVTVASEWINKLSCSAGTNTLDALMVAFSDPICEAVYLVSDGLPDQQPSDILRCTAAISEGRPIHAIYLTGLHAEVAAQDFLESLAVQTLGTFHVISMTRQGAMERVEEVVTSDHSPVRIVSTVCRKQDAASVPLATLDNPPVAEASTYSHQNGVPATSIKTTLDNPPQTATVTYKNVEDGKPVKYCSVTTSLDHNPVQESILVRETRAPRTIITKPAATAWETVRTEPIAPGLPLAAPSKPTVDLLAGMKILARREKDGYYCPGTIKEKLSALRSYLVFFDKDPSGSKCQNLLQETSIYDIIAYNDAMRHAIVPGDKVLAPWEKAGYRFAPGIVLDGIEGRSTGCAADSDKLVVSFFNGKTAKVSKQIVIWIPHREYERHKLEIQMPLTARHYVVNNPSYERLVSGYTVPSMHREVPVVESFVELPTLQHSRMYMPLMMSSEVRDYSLRREPMMTIRSIRQSAVSSEDMNRMIPGTGITKQELNVKVMKQLMDNKMLGSSVLLKDGIGNVGRSKMEKEKMRRSVSFQDDSFGLDSGIGSLPTERDTEDEIDEEEKLEQEVEEIKRKIADSEKEVASLVDSSVQTMSLRDAGVGTNSCLLYEGRRPKSAKDEDRPQWKYWRRTPQLRSTHQQLVGPFRETALEAPLEAGRQPTYQEQVFVSPVNRSDMFAPVDYSQVQSDRALVEWEMTRPRPSPPVKQSPSKPQSNGTPPRTAHQRHIGPFRETVLEAPLEARLQPTYEEPQAYVSPVNKSAMFTPVNHSQVQSDRAMMEWEMRQPCPPPPAKQGHAKPLEHNIGTRDQIREAKERSYIEFRRMQTVMREYTWYKMEQQQAKMKDARDERCRQYSSDMQRRDVQRQQDSEDKMGRILTVKQNVKESITQRQKEFGQRNDSKDQRRIKALRARQQERLDVQAQRDKDIQDTIQHKEEVKRQHTEERSQQHVDRLCERRKQEAARDLQMRNKELHRRAHFRDIERHNQERKDIRIAAKEQQQAEYRSQVLP